MGVPKKRTSVARKGLRRAGQHHKLYRSFTTICSNCKETLLPHKVCSSCGFYKGTSFLTIASKEKAQE